MPFFGSPTKLFEYMGLGGGIIGTDLEQIGQVLRPALFAASLGAEAVEITNERAVLCTPGDCDEFVRACVYLTQHLEIVQKLGQNARAAAERDFTWKAHVERLWRFVAGDASASWESEESARAIAQEQILAVNQAGMEAQKQWNTNPCGAVEGIEVMDLDYFLRVEANRYNLEGFIPQVFPFDKFCGKNVLEIGCGHGTDSIQFARNGANCHVADITDRHLGLTIKNFELQGYPLAWKKCDAAALDYPDNYFDCIYSHGVLHHIPDLQKVLAEIKRVLKPGGTLCLSVYNQFSAFHFFSKLLADGWHRRMLFTLGYAGLLSTIESGADGLHIRPYVKLYRKGEFRRALGKAGFDVQTAGVANLMPSHFERWQDKYWPKWQKYEHILGWYVYTISQKPL
jgi:ubiquinone/menaquinone biosynthesis C-methylase UbiE